MTSWALMINTDVLKDADAFNISGFKEGRHVLYSFDKELKTDFSS